MWEYMIKGFGLHDLSSKKYSYENFKGQEKLINSIEKILGEIGYEKTIPINLNTKTGKTNIWGYESPGEGGCIVTYEDEDKNSEDHRFYIMDKKNITHLTRAYLQFLGATGSLIQRTKEGLKKADFPYFEI